MEMPQTRGGRNNENETITHMNKHISFDWFDYDDRT